MFLFFIPPPKKEINEKQNEQNEWMNSGFCQHKSGGQEVHTPTAPFISGFLPAVASAAVFDG